MLKEIREKNEMTQEELAELCGVGRSTITMIEIGKNKPSYQLERKISEIFQLPIDEIFD